MSEYKLVNLTPHAVNFFVEAEIGRSEDGRTLYAGADSVPFMNIEPSGQVARLTVLTVDEGETLGEIPLVSVRLGELVGLPPEEAGVMYIVSMSCSEAVRRLGRTDCLLINQQVRNGAGKVVGALSLSRIL